MSCRTGKTSAVSLERLLDNEDWDQAREKLETTTTLTRIGVTRIGKVLYHICDRPDVPPDIFQTLLSKLSGNRPYKGNRSGLEDLNFWKIVGQYRGKPKESKNFRSICYVQNPESLKHFLMAYVECFGTMQSITVHQIIWIMWEQQIHGSGTQNIRSKVLLAVSSREDLSSHEELRKIWEKTELLIRAAYSKGLKMEEIPLIRTMIVSRATFPKLLLWFAIKMRPEQIGIQDDQGRLPLHWAAEYNAQYEQDTTWSRFDLMSDQLRALCHARSMVEMVLDAYPEGARHRDTEGRFPLSLLLLSEYNRRNFKGCSESTLKCAEKLLQHAPEALTQVDPKTGMLPFMTAAALQKRRRRGERQLIRRERYLRKLQLIYSLLRKDPTVVASGIHPPSEGKRRLEDTQAELKGANDEIERLKEETAPLKKRNLELESDASKRSKTS